MIIKNLVVKELILNPVTGLDRSNAREIFLKEAEFMKKFDHKGLPKMYDIFCQDDRDYLVMDYIEGKTLEEIINASQEPVNEKKAIKWIIEVSEIIDYLHNSFHSPVVYRDLKPSNIIITPENEPKLVDFGIARYYNPDKDSDTFNYGSPGYAAPEQYRGHGQTSPQTDIFGLGVILYQMLTKYDPVQKPLHFPELTKLNPSISKKLALIVSRAIELDPKKRYISMIEFKEKLEKYLSPTVSEEREEVPCEKPVDTIWPAVNNFLIPLVILLFAFSVFDLFFGITPLRSAFILSLIFGVPAYLIIYCIVRCLQYMSHFRHNYTFTRVSAVIITFVAVIMFTRIFYT